LLCSWLRDRDAHEQPLLQQNMKLSQRTFERLSQMVIGDAKYFPYRSSSEITNF
jgi:hypothetical protein